MCDVTAIMMTHNAAQHVPVSLPPLIEACREVVVLDMESTDDTRALCERLLRPEDLIVSYARQNLFSFGFSHPRNYAAKFATSEWLLAIDSDEYIEPVQLSRAFSTRQDGLAVFDLERRNYTHRHGFSLNRPADILAQAEYTTERHRRLYRRDPTIRYEGLIHEEIWDGASNAYATCGRLNATLHHLSAYGSSESDKHELYAYLLLKAQAYPGFRYGTNVWFFEHYVPENLEVLLLQANNFSARHNLSMFERHELKL